LRPIDDNSSYHFVQANIWDRLANSRLRRPANAALDSTKKVEVHGILLPSFDAPLHACIEQIREK
jgi:hypothetical protein